MKEIKQDFFEGESSTLRHYAKIIIHVEITKNSNKICSIKGAINLSKYSNIFKLIFKVC